MSETLVDQFKSAVIAVYTTGLETWMERSPNSTRSFTQMISEATFEAAISSNDMGPFPVEGGEFVQVHSEGGREGDGEYVQRVYELDGRFVEVTGNYTSWDGIDWDYGYVGEVSPRTVTSVVYS